MLNLNQDEFISNYVTTFLGTCDADRYCRLGDKETQNECPPVREAILRARRAWYTILEYGYASPFTRSQNEPNALELGAAARKAGIVK